MSSQETATLTSQEQYDLERDVGKLYGSFWKYARAHPEDTNALTLARSQHEEFLWSALGKLSGVRHHSLLKAA
jgi:hypothetical protein